MKIQLLKLLNFRSWGALSSLAQEVLLSNLAILQMLSVLSTNADGFSLTVLCPKLKNPRKGYWPAVISFRGVASHFFSFYARVVEVLMEQGSKRGWGEGV